MADPVHQLDRDELRVDILICYRMYGILSGVGSASFAKRQIERLNSIRKHANTLVELLKADDADMGITQAWRPIELLPQLSLLVKSIDAIKERQEKPRVIVERVKKRLGTSYSAMQWLTGVLLPLVFSKHFRRPAKISRDPNARGALGGPYIRFARQVIVELGLECSDETIASALRMVKLEN